MEGTDNGKQRRILSGTILDEEIDDIAFPIDHVCGCRSDSPNGPGIMGIRTRTAAGIVGRQRTCDLESRCWLWPVTVSSATVYG